jgi:Type IIA topoisomerase (DNA gyrase/topo II, topoisomerase IV), A subunit
MKAVHPDNLDDVIAIIRKPVDLSETRESLMSRLNIDIIQTNAILEMNLKRLNGIQIDSMQIEFNKCHEENVDYRKILDNISNVYEIILTETQEQIQLFSGAKEDLDKYWTIYPYSKRLTEIHEDLIKTDLGSLTKEEDSILLYSNDGYIRRIAVDEFKEQRRGTQGNRKFDLKKNDYIISTTDTHSHDDVMFITEKGQAFTLKAYEISTNASGRHINNLLPNKKADEKL